MRSENYEDKQATISPKFRRPAKLPLGGGATELAD